MWGDALIERWAALVTRRAPWVMLLLLFTTVLAASALVKWPDMTLKLRVDPSINRLLGDDDPAQRRYQRYRTLFGNDDVVVIAVGNTDVRDPETIRRLAVASDAIARIDGIYQVASLATVPVARSEGQDLLISTLTELTERAELQQTLLQNPLFGNVLYSEDYSVASLLVSLKDLSDGEFLKRGMTAQITSAMQDAFADAPEATVWVSGTPVVKAATAETVLREFRGRIPVVLGLVALFLLLAFRSARGVVMPMIAIGLALIWSLGVLAALDVPLNLITSLVPTLITILGLAYSMHMMTAYFRPLREDQSEHLADVAFRIQVTLKRTMLPLLLTGVTTGAGFLALYASNLAAIREFALVSTLGIFCVILLVLTFIPASLALIPNPRFRLLPGNRWFTQAANWLGGVVLDYRPIIIRGGFLFLGICLLASTQIRTGTHYVDGFRADSPVRQSFEAINAKLAGANSIAIVLEGHVDNTFVDPEVLGEIELLQSWLDAQPEVGKTASLVDVVKLLNRDLSGDPDAYELPESASTIKQLLVFGGGAEVDALVDKRFATTQIRVQTPLADSRQVRELAQRIEQRLEALPARLDAGVTGNAVMATNMVDALGNSQISSIALALLAVYIVLVAMFSSWKVGFVALLPNLIPVAAFFGVLGALDMGLNPTTSLIACIVLGIAVDDTIHFLVRFNLDARALASERDAVRSALRHVIRPVTFTSVALILGFLYLTTSELQNQVRFGALAAFTIGIAWLVDVLFTPALGSTMRIVTLWDSLKVDLGRAPQETIRFLNGLTNRQARTFALLTHLDPIEQGTRLIRVGADARDMYVLVDGRLKVWVESDDGSEVKLAELGRGAVLGEVGSFGQKRSANVDVLESGRVLRFNDADLEKLRTSHPAIAATLYRNLNRIQAERVANTTQQLKS